MGCGRIRSVLFAPLLLVSVASPAFAFDAAHPSEQRTTEAFLAADEAWGNAETHGNAGYIDWLLLDGYASIGADGRITTKQQIVEGARKHGNSQELAKEVADWKAAHPSRADVKLFGDTGMLTWVATDVDTAQPVNSSDIFVYRDGHWHGVYSQHSTAPLDKASADAKTQ